MPEIGFMEPGLSARAFARYRQFCGNRVAVLLRFGQRSHGNVVLL